MELCGNATEDYSVGDGKVSSLKNDLSEEHGKGSPPKCSLEKNVGPP